MAGPMTTTKSEVVTFGSNQSSDFNMAANDSNSSPDKAVSPDPNTRKENSRKSKKDSAKASKTKTKSKDKKPAESEK